MEDLTKEEKRLLAFVLFGGSMRIGRASFAAIESIAKKVGVEKEFEDYAKDWIDYSKTKPKKDGDQ